MKTSKILAASIALQALATAAFAQQEPPPQEVQQELQQALPAQQQQIVQQGFQQAAQQEPEEPGFPANTITVDFGPTIIGILFGVVGNIIDIDISGFGIGAQYERQLFERLSVAGRFAYLGSSIEYEEDVNSAKAKAELDLSSFSLEAHPRTYPFGGSFFLDGMLGYADISIGLKGNVSTNNGTYAAPSKGVSRGYFKYGAKLGWRADFGEPGGFIFEHSYGWYGASGMGKTMGQQLSKKLTEAALGQPVEISKDFDDVFSYLENWLFAGGPRVTFAFGWKF